MRKSYRKTVEDLLIAMEKVRPTKSDLEGNHSLDMAKAWLTDLIEPKFKKREQKEWNEFVQEQTEAELDCGAEESLRYLLDIGPRIHKREELAQWKKEIAEAELEQL